MFDGLVIQTCAFQDSECEWKGWIPFMLHSLEYKFKLEGLFEY